MHLQTLYQSAAVVAALLAPAKARVYHSNVQGTCAELHHLLASNETFTAESAYYTPLYEVPWSARNWMKPGCIVTPKNTREVAKVMKVLTARKTKFAVRSGGHTSIPGFASVGSDGVLVALQNLNKLAVSKDKKIATVGPGNRWGTVYQFLTPHGVSVAGGRLPDVGVGGFLLGGGLSFFYNQYGFGADQIARYRVVLTDGSIVDATPTKNANLYHGLKGGLTNLGVVTEFDLMTNNFVNFFYTVQQYNLSQASNLLKAYANYLTDENSDVKSSIQLEFTNTFALAFYGYGEFAAEPAVFESFRKIPAAKVLVPPTNGSVVALLSSTSGSGNSPGRAIGATVSHKVVDAKFMIEAFRLWTTQISKLPADFTYYFIPQGINSNMIRAGRSRNGGNLYGLQEIAQNWLNIYVTYGKATEDNVAKSIVDSAIDSVRQRAVKENLFLPFVFVNDAGSDQKPLQSFGAANFARIKAAAAKYDPRGVMQTLQNDGYLISNES